MYLLLTITYLITQFIIKLNKKYQRVNIISFRLWSDRNLAEFNLLNFQFTYHQSTISITIFLGVGFYWLGFEDSKAISLITYTIIVIITHWLRFY